MSPPASLRRCCPPDFTAAVHPPGLAADLPPSFPLLRASAQPGSRPRGVPSVTAFLLRSTSTCQPSCVHVWPPPSGSGLFPTESTPSILSAWILSSLWAPSYFAVLWPLRRPNAPPAAPSIPAIAVPLRAPPFQWSHAAYVCGSEQPPASGPPGGAGPAWRAGGVPPPAERWGFTITQASCMSLLPSSLPSVFLKERSGQSEAPSRDTPALILDSQTTGAQLQHRHQLLPPLHRRGWTQMPFPAR